MTLILAHVTPERSYILGDAAASSDEMMDIVVHPKVWKTPGPHKMLFGYTDSFRNGNLLQYYLNIPEHPEGMSDIEYMSTDFTEAIIDVAQRGLFATEGDEGIIGGEFICVYRGSIYNIQSNFACLQFDRDYLGIGSGEMVAKGAMFALADSKLSPEAKMLRAAEAAAKFSRGVAAPFTVLSQKNPKDSR